MNLNECKIIGRVGKDPEFRDVGVTEVCSFSVAVDESYKKKDGTKVENTQWFNVELWGHPMAKWIKKGTEIYISGKMKQEQYTKDGQTRYIFKIIGKDISLGASPKTEATQPTQPSTNKAVIPDNKPANKAEQEAMESEDLPF